MAVQKYRKRRIFLVCADELGVIKEDSPSASIQNNIAVNYDRPGLPKDAKLSAVISAPDKKCREYAKYFSDGKVPISIIEGIRDLTDEEIRHTSTPRRVISAYREVLSSYDGDIAVIASTGYLRALIGFLECRDFDRMKEIDILPGFIYEVAIPGKLCAIIAADDNRGNELYQPMPSDESPYLMEYMLDTFTRAGVAEAVIVCRSNKEKLEKSFGGPGRTFVHTDSFSIGGSLDGVSMELLLCEGLLGSSEWDGVFMLPSSVPVFTLFSVQQLLRSMGFEVPYGAEVKLFSGLEYDDYLTGSSAGMKAGNVADGFDSCQFFGAVPVYRGERGYPILLRPSFFKKILDKTRNNKTGAYGRDVIFDDEKAKDAGAIPAEPGDIVKLDNKLDIKPDLNLCDLIENIASKNDKNKHVAGSGNMMEVTVPDPAVVLYTKTQSGCEKAKDYLFSLRTPGLAYCRELLQWMDLPKSRLRHSEQVSFYAREMAEEFNSRGRDTYSLLLDENITAAGGMLHDIAKGYPRHAAVGAAILRSLNMARAAEIVENHQNLAERYFSCTSPVLIVYLADKMFCGDELVGIEERFRRKREKQKDDGKAQKKLAYKEKQALRAKEVYENSILGWPVG